MACPASCMIVGDPIMILKYTKTVEEWADHIIEKFGKNTALIFAGTWIKCPCILADFECDRCGYARKDDPCVDSETWFYEVYHNDVLLKQIRKIIVEKCRT